MKKNGRPELLEDEKSSQIVKFRCTKKEKETLITLSKEYNISLSEYLLKKGFDEKLIPRRIELISKLSEINLEISRAGNNINQLAKHANRVKKEEGLEAEIFMNFTLLLNEYVKKIDGLNITIKSIYRELAK